MSSLKTLLNSKSFDSVTTSNLEMTNSNGRKRGAVLEEWLLRKFPELYSKSYNLGSTSVSTNDVENQPLNLVKRSRRDIEVKNETPVAYAGCAGRLYPKTLRANRYNRVFVQRSDSKQDIISSEYYVQPKGDLFNLKNEHLSKQVENRYHKELKSHMDGVETDKPVNLSLSKRRETIYVEWNEDESKTLPVSNYKRRRYVDNNGDARNSNSVIMGVNYRSMYKLQNNDKRIGENICSFAANKQIAKRLTTPKLTKHNDAAYYPNIQCLLCREWVCSRNRYMHVESHLQYRPYKCSFCGYDNRKEIFIMLHIKKVHGGRAEVIRDINTELEHEAWNIAERCVEHTRDVLKRAHQEAVQNDKASASAKPSSFVKIEEALLSKYSRQYRPKLYNIQRAEKSLIIEDSLKMGIVPDFSEVSNREVKCQICNGFVLSHVTVMEEHTRSHLTQPSYRCSVGYCTLKHHSKNFLTRHMKEVHKYKQTPTDIIELDPSLKKEFCRIAFRCFPSHFSDHLSSFHIFRRSPVSQSPLLKSLTETNWCVPSTCSVPSVMQNTALSMSTLTSTFKTFSSPGLKPTSSLLTAILPLNLTLQTPAPSNDVALLLPTAPIPSRDASHFKDLMSMSNFPVTNLECQPFVFHAEEHNSSNCITLTNLLAAAPKNSPSQTRVQSIIHPPTSRKTCSFCQEVFEDEYLVLYKHVKQHLSLLPYECSVCKFAHVDRVTIQDHVSHDHLQATLVDRMTESVSRQCSALFTACFPDVPLQPLLHDSVQKC
uniref:C2H2-type domain-containing protein n=1 Tax=Wuchereria bancrofti TaxID=6293 RepID=A0AAF5PHE3_WUCBA